MDIERTVPTRANDSISATSKPPNEPTAPQSVVMEPTVLLSTAAAHRGEPSLDTHEATSPTSTAASEATVSRDERKKRQKKRHRAIAANGAPDQARERETHAKTPPIVKLAANVANQDLANAFATLVKFMRTMHSTVAAYVKVSYAILTSPDIITSGAQVVPMRFDTQGHARQETRAGAVEPGLGRCRGRPAGRAHVAHGDSIAPPIGPRGRAEHRRDYVGRVGQGVACNGGQEAVSRPLDHDGNILSDGLDDGASPWDILPTPEVAALDVAVAAHPANQALMEAFVELGALGRTRNDHMTWRRMARELLKCIEPVTSGADAKVGFGWPKDKQVEMIDEFMNTGKMGLADQLRAQDGDVDASDDNKEAQVATEST
ncbi:Aste57867_1218 [Aphanomyces stellatus]|uniref:Aste57867_1218 protein n=1 Tax=Aphanomyces stellatus TaxID=120398 RepID=A0A485K9R9_9STRA|nr:hypothetical protein As57867_001217 [Aphanomyces stellatus]VFT78438.1 Aste57867_1218 [Aphanomyces stellatus]